MVTVKQALAIVTRNAQPPWRAADLRVQSDGTPISLQTFVDQVANKRALIFVKVRPLSIVKGVSSVDELKSMWAPGTGNFGEPWVDDLQNAKDNLSRILSAAGGSIAYVANDGQTVGVNGTFDALLKIRIVSVTDAQYGTEITVLSGSQRNEIYHPIFGDNEDDSFSRLRQDLIGAARAFAERSADSGTYTSTKCWIAS